LECGGTAAAFNGRGKKKAQAFACALESGG